MKRLFFLLICVLSSSVLLAAQISEAQNMDSLRIQEVRQDVTNVIQIAGTVAKLIPTIPGFVIVGITSLASLAVGIWARRAEKKRLRKQKLLFDK